MSTSKLDHWEDTWLTPTKTYGKCSDGEEHNFVFDKRFTIHWDSIEFKCINCGKRIWESSD